VLSNSTDATELMEVSFGKTGARSCEGE
jgi:hypothetical protein